MTMSFSQGHPNSAHTVELREKWLFLRRFIPLFQQCLPKPSKFPCGVPRNGVTAMRISIKAIPLKLQQISLDSHREGDCVEMLVETFQAILSKLERLVVEKIPRANLQHESSWQNEYPKLMAMADIILSKSDTSLERVVATASAYLAFENLTFKDYRSMLFEWRSITEQFEEIENHLTINSEEVETLVGNTGRLTREEVSFITHASKTSDSSDLMYSLLSRRIMCKEAHPIKMQLSDFSDLTFSFDLDISTTYEGEGSTRAKLTHSFGTELATIDAAFILNGACICHRSHWDTSGQRQRLDLAFDDGNIWHKTASLNPADPRLDLCQIPLCHDGSILKVKKSLEMELSDQRGMEITLANSLLHLNKNRWLHRSWKAESIFLTKLPEPATTEWMYHILSHLEEQQDGNDEDLEDTFEDILSFGLLLMQIESTKHLALGTANQGWEAEISDTFMKLQIALIQGQRCIEKPYRAIGQACLEFRERFNRLSFPGLPNDLKRTAAIYKYIFQPLWELNSSRHEEIGTLSRSPPPLAHLSTPPAALHGDLQDISHPLKLFDEFESSSELETRHGHYAAEFIESMGSLAIQMQDRAYKIPPYAIWRLRKPRIAIIDTGADFGDVMIETCLEEERIKSCQGFVADEGDVTDEHGHGTLITRLILKLAPSAEIYIAKVSKTSRIESQHLSRISKAIHWAVTKNVDMISMSFGIHSDAGLAKDIRTAIWKATKQGIVCFAAASNDGGNSPRAFPANMPEVICIHASDGLGNPGDINPGPVENECNFSTLGISIRSDFNDKTTLKSGTSFATPVAVAIAANILEFWRCHCDYDEDESKALRSHQGIVKAFRKLSDKRGGYDYLMPTGQSIYDLEGKLKQVFSEIVAGS